MIWLLLACGPGDDTDPVDAPVAPAWSEAFADAVVSFTPGEGAGYGQDALPGVVLGAPLPPGNGGGSLDVLSLGREGEIVLRFDGPALIDGEGVDLLVFENPFVGWYETGVVAASDDGVTWAEWPCDAEDAEGGFPGCAGVAVVYANAENGLDPTDPEVAGGDAFDLADIGLAQARFVRVRDSGMNPYEGVAGGFDLDAVAIVNGE